MVVLARVWRGLIVAEMVCGQSCIATLDIYTLYLVSVYIVML